MAFVSASPKNIQFANRTSAPAVGPGQYDIDSTEHKQLMAMLRPKKNAPFNQTAKRPHHAEPRKTFRQTPGKLTIPLLLFIFESKRISKFLLSRTRSVRQQSRHLRETGSAERYAVKRQVFRPGQRPCQHAHSKLLKREQAHDSDSDQPREA